MIENGEIEFSFFIWISRYKPNYISDIIIRRYGYEKFIVKKITCTLENGLPLMGVDEWMKENLPNPDVSP